jgi:simple sugar transport system permease protein
MVSATVITFIQRAIMQGIPILYGSTGEILTEKSGHLNLGIPGIMYVGGISGVIGAFLYENKMSGQPLNPFLAVAIPLLCSAVGSLLMGLVYCFLTVSLRANQNVTGLAITTFGVGFGNFFGASLVKLTNSEVPSVALSATSRFFRASLPFADKLGVVGQIFFSYGFMTYAAIIIAVIAGFVLRKTRTGLYLRSVGESPATADAAGINVTKYKYLATCIGAGVSGFGGTYYVMNYIKGTWENQGTIEALGWLAVALVIFATWKPLRAIWGSYLFGMLYWAFFYIGGLTRSSQELFKMLPYVVTIFVLLFVALRKRKEDQPPMSLGLPYFREER